MELTLSIVYCDKNIVSIQVNGAPKKDGGSPINTYQCHHVHKNGHVLHAPANTQNCLLAERTISEAQKNPNTNEQSPKISFWISYHITESKALSKETWIWGRCLGFGFEAMARP